MTDKELMDLVRAVACSPSPVKSSPAWQTLKAHCTQPTDVQQTQDEICEYHLPTCICTWDENRECEVLPCLPIRKLSSMR